MPPKKNIKFVGHDEASGVTADEEGNRFVEIKEWDMNQMHPFDEQDLDHGVKIVVCGHPGTGKSRVIEQIMLYKAHICPVSQIFSGTETVNHFYKSRSTDVTIYNELNLKAMEDFAKRQNIARQYLSNPWAMQILDDVVDDPYILKKSPFGAFYRKGRHWSMIHILASQYIMDMVAGIRACVDYAFIMPNSNVSEREKIYENLASGGIPSQQDFNDIMDSLDKHEALVIDNTSSSPLISDRVFRFKADLSRVPQGFKIGSQDAFDFDQERMNPAYVENYL